MRTTLIIPDVLVEESERLKREQLFREMVQGYEAEAREPSIESGWETVDGDGLS